MILAVPHLPCLPASRAATHLVYMILHRHLDGIAACLQRRHFTPGVNVVDFIAADRANPLRCFRGCDLFSKSVSVASSFCINSLHTILSSPKAESQLARAGTSAESCARCALYSSTMPMTIIFSFPVLRRSLCAPARSGREKDKINFSNSERVPVLPVQ